MHHLEHALAAGDRGQKKGVGSRGLDLSGCLFTLLYPVVGQILPSLLKAENWRWGESSNVLTFLSLVHPKLCKYLRCSARFCSRCQTAAALPAPSTLLCVLTAGIWEATALFQASVVMEEAENFRAQVPLLSLPLNMPSISWRVKITQHCLISGKSQMTVEGVRNMHTSPPRPTVSAVAS